MIDVAGYDSWRWNGFACSSLSESAASVSASLSTSWDSVSSTSVSSTALLVSSGKPGGDSYNTWQWGGFSRSGSFLPNNDTSSTFSILSLIQAAASTDESLGASLSGYVFYDENHNGIMETTDWAILDAELSLAKQGSSASPLIAYTDSNGTYTFKNLPPGTYSITLLTPCPEPGTVTLGVLRDADGNIVPDAGKIKEGGFYDIVLEEGYWGVYYLFAETTYPPSAVSKRLLINGGPNHTVPEPASLVLLVVAGLLYGGFARRRR